MGLHTQALTRRQVKVVLRARRSGCGPGPAPQPRPPLLLLAPEGSGKERAERRLSFGGGVGGWGPL